VDEIVEAIARLEDPASNDAAKREEIGKRGRFSKQLFSTSFLKKIITAKLPAAIANLDSVANIRNVQEADALLNQIKQAQPIVESYAQRLAENCLAKLFENFSFSSDFNKNIITVYSLNAFYSTTPRINKFANESSMKCKRNARNCV
jgi:hypothetical protein